MRPLLRFGIALGVAVAAPALADTISLKNGRHIEGHVIARTSRAITIEVPGGQMDLPRSQIARIEKKLTLEDDYALRYCALDPSNADALEELAAWAREHRLEARARALEEHARGVRLEQRFARARTARDFLAVAGWAKDHGFSTDVRRLAVARALEAAPGNRAALRARRLLDEEDAAREEAEETSRLDALAAREKALAERERILAGHERVERARTKARAPAAPPPAPAGETLPPPDAPPDDSSAGEGAPPPPPPGLEPPQPPVFILAHHGRRRPGEDDPNAPGGGGGRHAPPPPAPGPARRSSPNPIPPAPQLPPTPGFRAH